MTYHTVMLIGAAAFLAACAAPGDPGSVVQGGRPDCAACIEENPGDVSVCEKICHEHEGDTASPWAGSVLR